MNVERLASAIYNDIVSGLKGYRANPSINLQQLLDEVITTRLNLINLYYLKGLIKIDELLYTINCVNVDCAYLDSCTENKPTAHFEIPDIIRDFGIDAIKYIGSVDMMHPFNVVFTLLEINNLKYRKFKNKAPYVWINTSNINSNGMLDCYIFNAPFVKTVSIVAAFKDPRQITSDCNQSDKMTFLDSLIQEKITKEKVTYYKLFASLNKPNNLLYE